MLAPGNPLSVAPVSRRNSAITQCRASSSRSPLAGPGAGQEGVADADAVQDTGDLVVEVHRARQRVGLRVTLDQVTGMPRSASSSAAVQPTGPAPTTIDVSGCMASPFAAVTARL